MTKQQILKENTKVKNWISDWQKNNPYKKSDQKELNKKFSVEFKTFLINGKFSPHTITIFTS
jgi:hypothetical protein